ncbi:MAG: protein translocase subunit SecF [Desulfobacteraceae bacterium]|nr:MAG: protein translocase subunit SecF [Desulfobacteraceae bacterium]
MQIIKPDVNVNFVGRRQMAYGFSFVLLLASILSLVFHGGPKYGIDFAGGAEVLARFNDPVPIEQVKSALQAMNLKGSVQQYDEQGTNFYRILIAAEQAEGENLDKRLQEGLAAETKSGVALESFEMVGPQVGRDLREKALLAMFFALLFITVYISGRFELKWLVSGGMAAALGLAVYVLHSIDLSIPALMAAALVISLILFYYLNLKYAMGAIVALIHDVLITVGVFSIFGKEFTLPIIAALLTIIGYSLNDTIIVFDRIRENLRKYHKLPMQEIINKSINETLSRTILTSGTTLIVVLALFLLGGGIIHDFAFALLVGIGIGTYSSIFVASPILLAWQRKKVSA